MPSINQPPTITSNGGGASATVNVPENLTAVTIVTASDPNPGTTLHYSIAGGADASLFHIDDLTGALSFIAVPDFEAPGDANLDNTYDVTVRASDGGLFDDQSLAVNISNVSGVSDNFVPVTRFGSEFLVNTTTLNHQDGPSLAAFSDGRFVSVWTDFQPAIDDNSGGAIRGQIFDAIGAKAGTEFLVNTTTAGQQNDASVAVLSDGRFVVSWADYSGLVPGGSGSGPALRAQIFNASGTKSGAELLVSATSEGPEPTIKGLADGGFVIAWSTLNRTGPDTNAEGIRAQVFNSNGVKSGAEFQVNTTTTGFQADPAITVLNDGDFVVTWSDQSGTGGDQSLLAVRGQVFHPAGAPVGSEFLVNTTTVDDQRWPAITALADGRFVAAWSDMSQTGGDTDHSAVRGQVFNANGSKSGAEFLIDSVSTASDQWLPSIAGLPDGRFVAAWLDASTSQQAGVVNAIRAQVFNSDGSKSSVELLVDNNNSFHFAPSVAALADGRFVVNWSDMRQADGDTSGMGVRGQIFDPRGGPVHLTGTAHNDDYVGTRFDDSMSGGAGNDRLDGGAGNDTATFSQSFTKYAIQALGSGTLVVSGPDGVDTLANFEHLQFADATLEARDGAMITLDLDRTDAQGTGYVTAFTENASAAGIAGDLQIKDINPNGIQTITGAKVVLTNARAGDSLSIAGGLQDGITSTIDSSVPGVITLTLSGGSATGAVSNADYQNALSHVRFANSSDTPNTADRDITVTVSEGALDSNVAHATIHVTSANDAPVIASNGGGDTASVVVSENTTAVTTVAATDPDSASITYSIIGGSDAAKFQIDPLTGKLSFITAPDFESPADSDHNNTYLVHVRASDGSLSDDQAITVQVGDANDTAPIGPPPNDPPPPDTPPSDPTPKVVHWAQSIDVGPHPAGWLPAGIGDFNADGTSDLAWFNAATRDVDVWTLSNGQWSGSADIGTHPAGYQPVAFGDFNHDGTSDAAWYNAATGDLDLWKLANGQWAGSVDVGLHPAGWVPAGSGDFNGDGTSDIAWYNAATGNLDIWKMANGEWAGSLDVGSHPSGYQPALTGDFNGDGTSDIAWYNPASGDIDIWKIANGQWTGSVSAGTHPAGWQPLGAGDFNQDGTSDIVWYNPANNDIDIWLIKDGHWASSVDVGSHPAGSVAVGVGDFDHNGVSDIMWRDTTTGQVENWMLAYS